MNCRDLQDRFVDYLTGDADDGLRRAVEAHIASCASCREELEAMSLAWTKLGVLPERKPSPELRTRFYAMLESQKEIQAGSAPSAAARVAPKRAFRLSAWRSLIPVPAARAALAASLLAAGYLAGVFLKPEARGGARVAQLEAEVHEMRQTVSLSLLERPSSSDRLSGLSFAARVTNPSPRTLEALLQTLDEDPSTNVRLAAADALYLFRDAPGVREGLVRSLSRQTSPVIQVALINLLADIKEDRAAEALRSLIENEDLAPEVRRKAEWGLKSIV
ncbi:MAG: HEAT repeat domain-containing protein [Candidatus Aminicenantes bacterium]|nr:HEAT repeat domain-containing protein [Candidatus Aminicenantes bacterium]